MARGLEAFGSGEEREEEAVAEAVGEAGGKRMEESQGWREAFGADLAHDVGVPGEEFVAAESGHDGFGTGGLGGSGGDEHVESVA